MYDRICMIGSFLESAASWMVDKIIHCPKLLMHCPLENVFKINKTLLGMQIEVENCRNLNVVKQCG